MHTIRFTTDDSAVSPVVGVVLMVAITILLAATSAAFFLDFAPANEGPPTAAFTFEYDAGSPDSLAIEHQSGDSVRAGNLYVTVSDASTGNGRHDFTSLSGAPSSGSQVTAGTRVTFTTGSLDLADATVTVGWRSPDSDQSVRLATWRAP